MPLKFENVFTSQLPQDPETQNEPRQVYNACYSLVNPTPTTKPQLVAYSTDTASLLKLDKSEIEQDWFTQMMSGNLVLDSMQPYAMCYGGHQFGHWAGQLGDGRAINLGEVYDTNNQLQTLQLKGAGATPYSRTADGLAVLRSSVREFLCSEAMYYLGIPTTRALSLCLTGDKVVRDMFYDGHPESELGAVVCRVAPSFLRFGSYQLFAAREEFNELKTLIDYTIKHHFGYLGRPSTRVYEQWFKQVCESTCELIVDWMRVGFVHGVMNTDNLSILGLTIDYGPYGWLEGYEPEWTPNTTDEQGKRYAYANQPQIGQWNLYQLANAIYTVVGRTDSLEKSLAEFAQNYAQKSQQMYAQKLGFMQHLGVSDEALINQLFSCLCLEEVDFSIFFRKLANLCKTKNYTDQALLNVVSDSFYQDEPDNNFKQSLSDWLRCYLTRLSQDERDDQARKQAMNKVNPKYVLRNYLAQQAIDKANLGDFSEVENLLKVIQKPYDEQSGFEQYAQKRPEWARHKPGCSKLSCSS
ncbi:protein adenylyltransferase SelO [Aliikangiella sp. IMCC44653]